VTGGLRLVKMAARSGRAEIPQQTVRLLHVQALIDLHDRHVPHRWYHCTSWNEHLAPSQARLDELLNRHPHIFQEPRTMPVADVGDLKEQLRHVETLRQGIGIAQSWIHICWWHMRRFLKSSLAEEVYRFDMSQDLEHREGRISTSLLIHYKGSHKHRMQTLMREKTAKATKELMFQAHMAVKTICEAFIDDKLLRSQRDVRGFMVRPPQRESGFQEAAVEMTAPSIPTGNGSMPTAPTVETQTIPAVATPPGTVAGSHSSPRRPRVVDLDPTDSESPSPTGTPPPAQRRRLV